MHEGHLEELGALRARVARLEAALAPVGAALVQAHGMGIPDGAAAVRLTATEAQVIRNAHAGTGHVLQLEGDEDAVAALAQVEGLLGGHVVLVARCNFLCELLTARSVVAQLNRQLREAPADSDAARQLEQLQEAVADALFSRPDGSGYFLEPAQVTAEAVEGAAPLLQRVTVDVCEQLAADALSAAHEAALVDERSARP